MASKTEKGVRAKSKGEIYLLEGIRKAKSMTPSELPLSLSDTIICSSPKSGATWLKSLAFCIATRARFDLSSKDHPLLSSVSHDLVPFIEADIVLNHARRDPHLPLLSTHLPFSGLPDPVLYSGCKIVYICRNPKDVFVSFWHMVSKVPDKEEVGLTFENFFDRFCSDDVDALIYGNYWNHVVGYWKASLDYPERFLFLKYEDMMEDVVPFVKKLADFIGYPFEEGESGAISTIVEMCSFQSLSKLEVNKTGTHRETFSNSVYFRKAKVGDWSNYLTPEMANKIDQITLVKLANSGLVL